MNNDKLKSFLTQHEAKEIKASATEWTHIRAKIDNTVSNRSKSLFIFATTIAASLIISYLAFQPAILQNDEDIYNFLAEHRDFYQENDEAFGDEYLALLN
ncbi:MAG: hypothetical protein JNM93_11995 [Bacteriovoracaceae bacterium]|nr:hypothetical protein [Bacteriovoracaceae bacterium]